jgi:predicted nucleic acid-binding Zn ribbon protein
MPIYLYQNPETDEVLEVLQGMNDKHEYFDEQGIEWKRVL